ncbi:hypothetical protein F2Q70_00044741 [Brassica cretica]|uniref:Caleosin n=1 Tax=Brassica cretica TaxID=69181 RepID=A0A8S9KK06_BRACR|nr:hypothetical protein F2Q70_00044741 [Brassica cretica]
MIKSILKRFGLFLGVKFVPEEDNFLQRHVAFFDRNKDGIVYPSETYQGFRAIGCGYLLSAFASLFINMGLSSKTRPGKGFSFSFPIQFEEMFAKHSKTHPDALTGEELKQLLNANKEPNDRKGAIAGYTEWKMLHYLCKDKNGLLHKETVRAAYDGSLFEQLEKQTASKKHP